MVRYYQRLIIPICMAIHAAYAQQQQAVIVNDNRIVAQSHAQFQQQLRGPSTSTIPAASYVAQQQVAAAANNNIAPQQQAQQQLGPSAALPAAATTQSSFETTQSAQRQLQLEIAVGNSDQYAESVLTIKQSPKAGIGIGANLHNQVGQLLSMTTEMVQTAKILAQNERTLSEGKNLMVKARGLFGQAVNFIQQQEPTNTNTKEQELNDERDLLRKNAPVDNTHYIDTAVDDEEGDDERALRITRQLYETMVTFPECLEQLFQDCLDRINSEIAEIGLSTIEVVVHEKRNSDQDGYNKVVIVTNQLADGVKGRVGDGIVTYPFLWDDALTGPRTLGVDGKWNCQNMTPDECCNSIKQSVPHPDVNDKNIECHIFVPFGGIGNPRRNDRVFITLSPDGRVHEPPIIQ